MKKQLLIVASFLIITIIGCNNKNGSQNKEINKLDKVDKIEEESADDDKEIDTLRLISWRSHLAWRGSSSVNSHSGKIIIDSGYVVLNKKKKILGGKFFLNMNSITVADLKGEEKEILENHLKGHTKEKEDHFFNSKKYPTAVFEVTNNFIEDNENLLEGDLTLKGTKDYVEAFPIAFSKEAGKLILSSENFDIDRTRWGVNYASSSIYDDLKDEIIRDFIKVRIKVYFDYN
ncbi:YceI-like domain-containing protein [Aquimarina amphilecti]|uniref:YceI-like domain-containing protein n=1 Tax=Aquimarina amphilecti TaxID=1038014 RepID=A0A1H7JT88_AQUAM|nr:YceI family protein [Aquimarina amphilecti]SEK77732.1 YceI-like domain-containing protein [Aquimarina amphilecti]